MKVLKGIAAVLIMMKMMETINDMQSALRHDYFMSKVDHTEFELDEEGAVYYTFYMKDGSTIEQDHYIYQEDFSWF
jgi:hypothetical protein